MKDQIALLDQLINLNIASLQYRGGIPGDYSLEHLKKFHKVLLKDVNIFNLNLNPGELRGPNLPGLLYQRDRQAMLNYMGIPFKVTTVHSQMKSCDIYDLEKSLGKLKIESYKNLMTNDFAVNIAQIYIKCDYIHPFNDVNTRTLFSFLNQFSTKCGFKTFFDPDIKKTPYDLGQFYISRAKSVNEYGIKLLNKEDRVRLQTQMNRFSNFPNFPDFLTKNTLPYRAIAFNDLIADSAENSKGDLKLFLYNMHHNAQYVLSSYPELKEPIDVLKGTIGHTIKNQRMTEDQKEIFINNAAHSACDLLAKGYHTFNSKQLYEESCKNLNINSTNKADKSFER